MKPQAHLFLRDSQLFVTTETIPDKPVVHVIGLSKSDETNRLCVGYPIDKTPSPSCNDNPEIKCACKNKLNKYHAVLASIRERAVLVQNQAIGIQMWWVQETPNEGITRADWLKTKAEGEFYLIECEVRYEWQWHPIGRSDWRSTNEYYIIQCQSNGAPTRKVAILSPIEAQGENDHIDDDFYLWPDAVVYGNGDGSKIQIGNDEYVKVTRNK